MAAMLAVSLVVCCVLLDGIMRHEHGMERVIIYMSKSAIDLRSQAQTLMYSLW